jgi:hypothetical protein
METSKRCANYANCGKYVQKPRRGPTGDYCSAACRNSRWRDRHPEVKAPLHLYVEVRDRNGKRVPFGARIAAPTMRMRSDEHETVGHVLADYIDGLLKRVAEVGEREADEAEAAVVDLLGGWAKSLQGGRDAREDDIHALLPRLWHLEPDYGAIAIRQRLSQVPR